VASKTIEVFLQTGKAAKTHGAYDEDHRDRYLAHEGEVSVPRVQASEADGYTEEEARAEAARCLRCDCDACLAGCEMLARFKKDPQRIGVEVYTDMNVNPPFSTRAVTREAYSCNICGYCKSVCPVQVNMGPLLQLSRSARMSAGIHPAALHDFWLREMDFATSEGAFTSAPKGKETCEYLFYPGCQLGAFNPEHVLLAYETLSRSHDIGVFLGCCGAPAYWAGDEARLQADIDLIRRQWSDLGKPTMVFACATCGTMFALFLPEIPRVSLYELLEGSEAPIPGSMLRDAAVFDPCAAREDPEIEAAVRRLAEKAGISLEELEKRNRCCGYGGHMRLANPSLYDEITEHRAKASDKPYIVYCANCKEVFASKGKPCAHILDIVFALDSGGRMPTLEEKRENSLRVKRELMKRNKDIDFEPERHEWDSARLVIGSELKERLEQKLISEADLKEAIWMAEQSGDKFCDEAGSTFVACLVRPVITYWVRYRKVGPDTYEVLSAYYHRMRLKEGEQAQ
jgi:Fe-S oxidoreductase